MIQTYINDLRTGTEDSVDAMLRFAEAQFSCCQLQTYYFT